MNNIWYPCSQMKDYENFPPFPIHSANGSYITLKDGSKIMDAISSWWCKSLGHAHPRLTSALIKQCKLYEHVISPNIAQDPLIQLSEKLTALTPNLKKVMYASDGSTAVEMAIKLSLHMRYIKGEKKRKQILSLENGYHGETLFTLGISDISIYKNAYKYHLPKTTQLKNIPYVNSQHDPLWHDCSVIWPQIEAQLNIHKETASAIILEPIIQAASGMHLYSQDFLKRLSSWSKQNNIHLIADEIMTGLGRTGLPLACQHSSIEPDLICLGKGLTAGYIPMSAVLVSNEFYDLCYADYEKGYSFLHSNTYSGNALAAAVALECLKVLEAENIYTRVRNLERTIQSLFKEVAQESAHLKNIRGIGFIVAGDLVDGNGDLLNPKERKGYAVFQKAIKLGALLRPLGNTIYWCPPLNTDVETLLKLKEMTSLAIKECF